jgi:riboflavin biosynthesis pyrimidine reductase
MHDIAQDAPDMTGISRFEAYSRRKQAVACAATLHGFRTVFDAAAGRGLRAIGNDWTRALCDGPFYIREPASGSLPAVSLVFVQSRGGNTEADDPSDLGGGDTDKHLIYEGLSRVAADAVLAGASTARGPATVFSVWHPELVALRLSCGKPRHPAQVVVTGTGELPFDDGLMFTTPELTVYVVTRTRTADMLRARLHDRPWIEVVDAGEPLSMTAGLGQLRARGLGVISVVGGRHMAATLIQHALATDLYLTTSPIDAGEPGSPFHGGQPRRLEAIVEKVGRGAEAGVRFEHLLIQDP